MLKVLEEELKLYRGLIQNNIYESNNVDFHQEVARSKHLNVSNINYNKGISTSGIEDDYSFRHDYKGDIQPHDSPSKLPNLE